QVLICLLDPKLSEAVEMAEKLAAAAEAAGDDVLHDDREERPGVKFKDADLIGIPLRVVIGGKGLQAGVIEVKPRASKEVQKIAVAEAASKLAELVREAARGGTV